MQVYYARIGGVAAIVALFGAALFSLERARADFALRAQSPNAAAIEPGNTEYLIFRALQVEYDGGDPRPLLQRAAELNPYNSAPRIRLGLDAEIRGDQASAEKWLLDAVRIDRQFEPRWTLANFYFRRGNTNEFWRWMREALAVSYGDRRPAFELCWQMSDDAEEISRAMPERSEVLAAYLGWLVETHRTQAVAPVAMKLAADASYRPMVLGGDDALLDAGDAANALALWRAMGFGAPSGIYRGNFEHGAIGHGFDWHYNEVAGVTHLDIDAARAMHRISFNGRQPESCELMSQRLALRKGEKYRLSWNASIREIALPTGIEWRIGDVRVDVANGAGKIEFTAPSDVSELRLAYQRPAGEVRAEGAAELWDVAVVHR
jgi:hypothetical protein